MKNIHLEHPEDSVLSGDLSVLDWFVTPGHLSVKIDGSPAVCWGINPSTGKFAVSTKSCFNKVKIKIAHSHEEIDAMYENNIAKILHLCFDYLPRNSFWMQGDWIGEGGFQEYTPNTITYKFSKIITENIIVAPHTVYVAEDDLRDAVAYPLEYNFENYILSNSSVKWVYPKASILFNAENFDVEEVCSFAKQMATIPEFISGKKLAEVKKQINRRIREQSIIEDDAFDCDPNLIRFWKLVKSIKEDSLFLCRNNGPEAYIGSDRIDSEGYVMTNKYGMYKLVNRESFSYSNFNNQKNWCK